MILDDVAGNINEFELINKRFSQTDINKEFKEQMEYYIDTIEAAYNEHFNINSTSTLNRVTASTNSVRYSFNKGIFMEQKYFIT